MKKRVAYLLAAMLAVSSLTGHVAVTAAETAQEVSIQENTSAQLTEEEDTSEQTEDTVQEETVQEETIQEETPESEAGMEEEDGDAQEEETDGSEEQSDDTAPTSEPAAPEEEPVEQPEDIDAPEEETSEQAGEEIADVPSVLEEVVPEELVSNEALNAVAPETLRVEPSETNGLPAPIDVFITNTNTNGWGNNQTTTYTCELYLPGDINPSDCFFSWGDGIDVMDVAVDSATYQSGACPVPSPGETKTYSFTGSSPRRVFNVKTYQGSSSVQSVFIDIDESQGTIQAMKDDDKHEASCTGRINIGGNWYKMPKMKGRGNASWEHAKDKKPYNITLDKKINFPGVSSDTTKKWTFMAEVTDHSLLCNRTGFYLAEELGIGQSTTSADVWMNGEYQGCYTVTPKTDSFVTKNGFMIEQDNYQEDKDKGDPQFHLDYLDSHVSGWSSAYNYITVKKIGKGLVEEDDSGDQNRDALVNYSINTIKPWLQDAWDAIRSDNGKNSKGRYYTDYIDIESFAKMYLLHEYVKSYDVCAGSILFYRDGNTDSDKLIAGPAWDLDNAMGATCQNEALGWADDRNHGDRRNGRGEFIPLVEEYKTSIYKTISKHSDFMEEVYRQYNKNKSAFDNLPNVTEDLINEISASAEMNHKKVVGISGNRYANTHEYGGNTTFESGTEYEQNYLATKDSKNDWGNYAANLKTYVTARSKWFANKFYKECDHDWVTEVTPPTCSTTGFTTKTCSKCGISYTEDETPIIPHDYQNGFCTMCDQKLLTATISCAEGTSVTVYETQDTDGACIENATIAYPRDSKTGWIDCGIDEKGEGQGQINLAVELDEGYEQMKVVVTGEPESAYKNLKVVDDKKHIYRFTKVREDFTISIKLEVPMTISHSCSLNNNLSVNYYVPAASVEGYSDYRLALWKQEFSSDGSTFTWNEIGEIAEYADRTSNGTAYKVFEFNNINAKEMGSEIRAVLFMEKDGQTYQSTQDIYSIKKYAYNMLNKSSDNNFKVLLVDMLNYGAEAQTYFGYNTSNPVNADLTEEQRALASNDPDLTSAEKWTTLDGATARFKGSSVVLGSNIELKYYMLFDSGAPADTVKLILNYETVLGGKMSTTIPASEFVDSGENGYAAKLITIAAKDMCRTVTAAIYDGDTQISDTFEYSIETYAYNKINDSKTEENLKSIVKQMMKYGKAAETYFVNK